jgi:hypothetical protein
LEMKTKREHHFTKQRDQRLQYYSNREKGKSQSQKVHVIWFSVI